MTEIPEHLLKRAAERRAAKSGGGDAEAPASGDAAAASPTEAAPAAVEKAPAAPTPLPTLETEAATVTPDIPVVAAAKSRKRVPYWAASVIALLPLWGVIYYASVQPPPAGESDPLVIGAGAYVELGCSGCHGANGEGGTGAQLSDGEVLKTFPDPLAMAHWLDFGAAEGARPDGTYGDPAREGGARNVNDLPGVMPAFPDVDPEELAALIIYVREELSGGTAEEDPLFNVETFESDPDLLIAALEAVKELGPTGDPDLVAIEGAETDSE